VKTLRVSHLKNKKRKLESNKSNKGRRERRKNVRLGLKKRKENVRLGLQEIDGKENVEKERQSRKEVMNRRGLKES